MDLSFYMYVLYIGSRMLAGVRLALQHVEEIISRLLFPHYRRLVGAFNALVMQRIAPEVLPGSRTPIGQLNCLSE